ncbi:MAG: extracellular solute-binding protein [Propionibacteriaceae bacterium]|jgi:multiple sugar transport system substrate-binding protein|nr:extracellular solute-binding protein [Propionibacteriaceae bacterium]
MRKRMVIGWWVGLLAALSMLPGCGVDDSLDPDAPVTLTMWHNFGGDLQRTMDELIDEFNGTVGAERGIIVSVEAISSSAELQDALAMVLNGDPGAPAMPDITTAYPKTAVHFQARGLLADLDAHFTQKELADYVPAFLEEGRLGDGGLYVFPFAKSTEILFVNQTLFDRFAAATGVTMDCFASFEGIARAAARYYEWTDQATPQTPGDGNQFFSADSWVNLAQAAMIQQGTTLFSGESLVLDNSAYTRIWENSWAPSVKGGFAVYDGYSSDLSKTGDIVSSTGSSAGILFYGDTVTYADGLIEPVKYSVLPFPVMVGADKVAVQRGNGFMVSKSDENRETAASVFLAWFTEPAQNMRFVSQTGYLPVTREAFETYMPRAIDDASNPYIRQMLQTVTTMSQEYEFFITPSFEAFDAISKDYEEQYKAIMLEERGAYLDGDPVDQASSLTKFIERMRR